MKKLSTIKSILVAGVLLATIWSCSKTEEVVVVPKLNYTTDIKSIFVTHCTPCHLAGGFKVNKWDDYATVKTNISLILDRTQRDPTVKGYMPQAGSTNAGLSAAEIAKLKQWVTDGLLEK
jgi:hypothetical protein